MQRHESLQPGVGMHSLMPVAVADGSYIAGGSYAAWLGHSARGRGEGGGAVQWGAAGEGGGGACTLHVQLPVELLQLAHA
jgi:hypothetical protein